MIRKILVTLLLSLVTDLSCFGQSHFLLVSGRDRENDVKAIARILAQNNKSYSTLATANPSSLLIYYSGPGDRKGGLFGSRKPGEGEGRFEKEMTTILFQHPRLKLMMNSCFSGRIQDLILSLASKGHNICASSVVDRDHPAPMRTPLVTDFSNLFTAARALQPDLNRLSSFDYINRLLKTGPYRRNPLRADKMKKRENKSPLPDLEENARFLRPYVQEPCSSSPGEPSSENLRDLERTLEKIDWALIKDHFGFSQEDSLTPLNDLQNQLTSGLHHLKSQALPYLLMVEKYQQKFSSLEDQIRRRPAQENLPSLREKYEELLKEAEKDLSPLHRDRKILEGLSLVRQFTARKDITSAQKKLFLDLLQCEMDPL